MNKKIWVSLVCLTLLAILGALLSADHREPVIEGIFDSLHFSIPLILAIFIRKIWLSIIVLLASGYVFALIFPFMLRADTDSLAYLVSSIPLSIVLYIIGLIYLRKTKSNESAA